MIMHPRSDLACYLELQRIPIQGHSQRSPVGYSASCASYLFGLYVLSEKEYGRAIIIIPYRGFSVSIFLGN